MFASRPKTRRRRDKEGQYGAQHAMMRMITKIMMLMSANHMKGFRSDDFEYVLDIYKSALLAALFVPTDFGLIHLGNSIRQYIISH